MRFPPQHAEAIVKAIGETVCHVTTSSNLEGIKRFGLLSPAELAIRAGADPKNLVLRNGRTHLTGNEIDATLNHQNPINRGLEAARRVIDDHGPEDWAQQLDKRVFFWPDGKAKKFQQSVTRDQPATTLRVNTRTLLRLCGDRLFLAPINTGNFTRGGAHARRGLWIYAPARDGIESFRTNRVKLALVKNKDRVAEISVVGSIQPDDLISMLVQQSPADGLQFPEET